MQTQRPYKRRRFFIKKEYQTYFILKFVLLVLAGGVLSTLLLLFLSHGTLTSTFHNSRLLVQKTALAILPSVILTNLVVLIIVGLATVFVVLYISHKIAGPLFRFEKDLNCIAEGDLRLRIRLREKDQFKDLAESLNRMTRGLNSKLVETEADLQRLYQIAHQSNIPQDVQEEFQSLLSSLQNRFQLSRDDRSD